MCLCTCNCIRMCSCLCTCNCIRVCCCLCTCNCIRVCSCLCSCNRIKAVCTWLCGWIRLNREYEWGVAATCRRAISNSRPCKKKHQHRFFNIFSNILSSSWACYRAIGHFKIAQFDSPPTFLIFRSVFQHCLSSTIQYFAVYRSHVFIISN